MTVAIAPNFSSEGSVFAGVAGGILYSRDGGENWYIATLPTPPPLITSLVISPNYTQDGTLLAGTLEDGVFLSTDGGVSWFAWNFGLLDLNVLCMAISPNFGQDETVFVGAESGIFCSKNGGRSWREVGFPIDLAPVISLTVSPNYPHSGILFVGTESCGLFRSDDWGNSWKRLGNDIIRGAVNAIVLPDDSNSSQIVALLNTTIVVSYDGGKTWSDWQVNLAFESAATCIAAPNGLNTRSRLLVGLSEGGVVQV